MVKPLKHKPNILERLKQDKDWTKRLSEARKLPKEKGLFNGYCNMSRCLKPGANWYNHSTRKYYCVECAEILNMDRFNKADAMDIWGHDLCTEGEYSEQKFRKLHDLHKNAKLAQRKLNLDGYQPKIREAKYGTAQSTE